MSLFKMNKAIKTIYECVLKHKYKIDDYDYGLNVEIELCKNDSAIRYYYYKIDGILIEPDNYCVSSSPKKNGGWNKAYYIPEHNMKIIDSWK